MANQGWIKIHRKIMDGSCWKSSNVFMVWCWCLLKANHEPCKFPFNGEDIIIQQGQFITGREKALAELPISAQTYKTCVKYLKSTNRITTKSTNRFTIISICKWKEYQDELTSRSTSKVNNHQTTTKQPLTTNKNVKNVKNVKKDITADKPPTKTPSKTYLIVKWYYYAKTGGKRGGRDLDQESTDFIKSQMSRNGKAASLLSSYSESQIKRAMNYCIRLSKESKEKDEGWDWTLETVGKKIDLCLSSNQTQNE